MEQATGAHRSAGSSAIAPAETVAHLRKANREGLLAVRSLLDALIARLECEVRMRS